MIKRRFYKLEHGDKDAASESSSSSDSEVEAEATDDSDEDVGEDDVQVRQKDGPGSPSSGYESEESSGHEINLDSSGLPVSDEEEDGPQTTALVDSDSVDPQLNPVVNEDEDDGFDDPDCVVKCKSVFKCKLCPRIVCLSRESLNAHLTSKRHARSEKLLSEGRLKVMLNDDGKLDEENTPTVASPEPEENSEEESPAKKKGQRGRRGKETKFKKKREPRASQARKRRKNDD